MKLPRHSDQRKPVPRWLRWKLIGTVLVFAVLIAISLRLPVIAVINLHNGEFLVSNYKMLEDDADHPRLKLLRKREHLDNVVEGASSQFEKIIRLRHWAHTQWEAATRFYYPAWDAVEILDLARKQNNRGFCAQYAIVFLQACQSMGLHARYVELPGHFLVAVWSDEFDRWIIMDPSNDIYYERNGIPLRGGQICRAYWQNNVKGIVKVAFDGARTNLEKKDLEVYRMYSIVEDADQLTHPPLIQVNGGAKHRLVRLNNFQNYPLIGRDNVAIGSPYLAWKESYAKEQFADKPLSDDPDDFRYPLNQMMINVARRDPDKGLVKLVLKTENCPRFKTFLVNTNNGGWSPVKTSDVTWELRPGLNSLATRVETDDDWQGPVSSVSVYYKPKIPR